MTGIWTIDAVRYGTVDRLKSDFFYDFASYDEPDGTQTLDYWFYVLTDGDQVIAVDTGFAHAVGVAHGLTVLADPAAVLAELPVSKLLVTHLHYDHVGNLGAVPTAEIVVTSAELAFWRSPIARERLFWQHTDPAGLQLLDGADADGRVTTFDSATSVAPGIVAITVGGHSAGQVILIVRTESGSVLLCSDAVHLYEELDRRRPFAILADLAGTYAGFEHIDALASVCNATVVPGHDPLVAERFPASDNQWATVRLTGADAEPDPHHDRR